MVRVSFDVGESTRVVIMELGAPAVFASFTEVEGGVLRAAMNGMLRRLRQVARPVPKSLEVDIGGPHWSRKDHVTIPEAWKVVAAEASRLIRGVSSGALGVDLVHARCQPLDVFGLLADLDRWR